MSYSGLKNWNTVCSGKSQIPCYQRLRLHKLTSSDLGTHVLRKCLYFSRRRQGRRISSQNTRHLCQHHKHQKYSVTPHSRFWALGTGTWRATMVQRKPTFVPLPSTSSAIATPLLSAAVAAASCCPPYLPSVVEDLFLLLLLLPLKAS